MWVKVSKDDLGRNAVFLPLEIRATPSLGPTKHHHRIRGAADLRVAFDWIPEQITGDKHIRAILEARFQVFLYHHNPAELLGVLGHGLPVAFGVVDCLFCWKLADGDHTLIPSLMCINLLQIIPDFASACSETII